jgi:flavin reductase (DIM6/NTAB) family NADH-FMN oxidoreductase RutF
MGPDIIIPPVTSAQRSDVESVMLAFEYGVHVVGSKSNDGTLNVMLADWVMQVSFKPRMVAVSLEDDSRTLRYVREVGRFTVNLLHDDGAEIARHVVMPAEGSKIMGRSARTTGVDRDKLEGLDYSLDQRGLPTLDSALGWITCDVREMVEAGGHVVVFGEVVDGKMQRSGEMLIERDLGWVYAG